MKPKAKRFTDWQPQVGEMALVPGNPANAAYIDTLTAKDIEGINGGHRGYAPLEFYVVFEAHHSSGKWTESQLVRHSWMGWGSSPGVNGDYHNHYPTPQAAINNILHYYNLKTGAYKLLVTAPPENYIETSAPRGTDGKTHAERVII